MPSALPPVSYTHLDVYKRQLAGDAPDLDAEADRYRRLLAEGPPVLVALGIGENGHLAFIDPGECDFDDPRDVRIVHLDGACRQQQVHDLSLIHI